MQIRIYPTFRKISDGYGCTLLINVRSSIGIGKELQRIRWYGTGRTATQALVKTIEFAIQELQIPKEELE